MKLHDLKPINESSYDDYDDYDRDDLKPGYTRGDNLVNKDLTFTVDAIKTSFQIHQEQIHSPTRYYRDSPPESESYAGEPVKVVIDEVTYIPLSYTLYDLDYEMDYRDLDKTSIMQDFYNVLLQYGEGLDNQEKAEYNTKVLPAFKKDPMFVKKLFAGIEAECDKLERGEI